MAVSEGVLLAVNDDGDIPSPLVLDELAVLGVGVVELAELVALPVGADLESGLGVLAADQEDTLDDTVVVGTVDGLGTEEVLAGSLKTGVETTDQVVGHEGKLQLVVVLVVNGPEGVLLGLVVLPEPGQSNGAGVLVGVLALPLVKDELGAAKSLKGVLGLLLLSGLGLSGGSGSGGSLLLGLLLLLGGSVLDALLDEDGVLEDSLEGGLVDDGLVPAGDGNVLVTELLVQDGSEGTGEESGSEVISQGDALANKEGVGSEVGVENASVLQSSLGSILDVLLVVAVKTQQRAEPGTEAGEELGVGEGQPTKDGSVVLLGLTQEGGLLVLGGHFYSSQHELSNQMTIA